VDVPVGKAAKADPESKQEPEPAAENASLFCPVCSERLAPRKCKLICPACGYYMSCSDYYWIRRANRRVSADWRRREHSEEDRSPRNPV